MSDKANKVKPIEERIAALFGSTAYRDEFGGGPATGMPNESVVRALGVVQGLRGATAVQTMETFYGQTLAHERSLRRAYEQAAPKPASAHDRIIQRFGSALAVRALAGYKYGSVQVTEYAELLYCRREKLGAAMYSAEAWYSGKLSDGLAEFKRVLRVPETAPEPEEEGA